MLPAHELTRGYVPDLFEPDEFVEPSQRGKDIYKTINALMHLYLSTSAEDLKDGIGPEEHFRRHFVFYAGFVSGLDYMAEYPNQAVKLLAEWRKHLNGGKIKLAVDETMARINEELYPFVPPVEPIDRLQQLKEEYRAEPAERVRPLLANGELKWDNVPPDKLPFGTYEEEFQTWM